jgi:hypothetical protein
MKYELETIPVWDAYQSDSECPLCLLMKKAEEETAGIQRKSMDRVEEEIHWYTQKFEFGNRDKPWGSSKDALQRGIQKMTGRFPDKES